MISPRLILCGGVAIPTNDPRREGRRVLTLSSHGLGRNVNIRMEDVAKVFQKHLSPRMKDLLEIAAYIYTADCATKRNGKWEDEDSIEPWHRDLHFVIPVRDLAFWQRTDVVDHPAVAIGRWCFWTIRNGRDKIWNVENKRITNKEVHDA